MKNAIRYTSNWEPVGGRGMKFEIRGEEYRTFKFATEQSTGELRVVSLTGGELRVVSRTGGELHVVSRTGGWMSQVLIDGEIVYQTRGFGYTNKRAAKSDAIERLRVYLDRTTINDERCP